MQNWVIRGLLMTLRRSPWRPDWLGILGERVARLTLDTRRIGREAQEGLCL